MAALSTIAIVAGGAAAAGGLAAGLSDEVSTSSSTQRVFAGDPTALETQGLQAQQQSFTQLSGLVGAGPGEQDVRTSLGASRDLAAQLQTLSQTGGLPGQADISATRGIAEQLFAPEQVQLQQRFTRQRELAQRESARLGRPVNDPILQARLSRQQTEQESVLQARIGSQAQQLALLQPERRLGFAQQRAGVLGGLATQAFQNRAALLSAGGGLVGQERNFRLATARRTTDQRDVQEGSFAQGLAGGLSGLGQTLGAFGGAGGFGGVGGGPTPRGSLSPGLGQGGGSLVNQSFAGINQNTAQLGQTIRNLR